MGSSAKTRVHAQDLRWKNKSDFALLQDNRGPSVRPSFGLQGQARSTRNSSRTLLAG